MVIIKHFLCSLGAAVNLIISQIEFSSEQLEIWHADIDLKIFQEVYL